MTSAPARIDDRATTGFVRPGFGQGSLFVKSGTGKIQRLAWEPVDGGEGTTPDGREARLRAVPPGHYTVIGYRLVRMDDAGTEWILSGIAPKGVRKFVVRAGQIHKIGIDPSITFGARGNARNGFMIQVPIQGPHHAGVTIYKDGKRIPMNYVVTGAAGRELERGKMNYG